MVNKASKMGSNTPAPKPVYTGSTVPANVLVTFGPKVANCRTAHTQLGWAAISKLLTANPKGQTMAQLVAVVTPNTQFVRYAYNNGWLIAA